MKTLPLLIQIALVNELDSNGELMEIIENIDCNTDQLSLEGRFLVETLRKFGITTREELEKIEHEITLTFTNQGERLPLLTQIALLHELGTEDSINRYADLIEYDPDDLNEDDSFIIRSLKIFGLEKTKDVWDLEQFIYKAFTISTNAQ